MSLKKSGYLFCVLFLSSINIANAVTEVDFIYIGDSEHDSLLGVKQGIDESNLQGEFLGQKYNLEIVSKENIEEYDFSKYIAILTSLNSKQLIHAYGPRKKVIIMPIKRTINLIEKTAKLKVKKIFKI